MKQIKICDISMQMLLFCEGPITPREFLNRIDQPDAVKVSLHASERDSVLRYDESFYRQ